MFLSTPRVLLVTAVITSLYGGVIYNGFAVVVGVMFMVGWVSTYITDQLAKASKAEKKVTELEAAIHKLETQVSSVNSKLNMVMPESKKFNRTV